MKKTLLDIVSYIFGSALAAAAISCFAAPNNIAAGGFSGIATLLNYIFGVPIGTAVLIMNIPVFAAGAYVFGMRFVYKSLVATVLMSLMIDIFAAVMPVYTGDVLLCSLFGGVLLGTGLAVIFIRGATTGGMDIIAKIINRKLPQMSIGVIILLLDASVVLAAALVYRNIESALYAVVMIFVQSKTIDALVYGMDKGKVLLINSQFGDKIAGEILSNMHRGVTILPAKGAYSNSARSVILCAVRPYEAAALKRTVRNTDKDAFVVSLDAGEVLGEGFRQD